MTAPSVSLPETGLQPSDGELIERSLAEPEVFAVLFDRYAADIHRYAARRLGASTADDLVAETFLVAFRRRGSYDTGRSQARPWLYGIATSLIARQRRSEQRLYRALARTGLDPLPEPIADQVVRRVAAQGQQRRLAAALAGLSVADREVLLLLAWGGLSYEEIAEALGVPVGTVRSRLHRARRKLRKVLGGAEASTTTKEAHGG
jgi:RNA polymerase sigma factor (sigma-70 family)